MKDMTFLNTSYSGWDMVGKPVVIAINYEGQMRKKMKWFPTIIILIMIIKQLVILMVRKMCKNKKETFLSLQFMMYLK